MKIAGIASSVLVASLGVLTGCSAPHEARSVTARQALLAPKPLNHIQASDAAFQAFGIKEWRFFGGKRKFVVTGYGASGQAVRGVSIVMVAHTDKVAAHMLFKMHDGTKAARRWLVTGKVQGTFNQDQKQLLRFIRTDFTAYGASHPAGGTMVSKSAGGIHLTAIPPSTGNACVDQEVQDSPQLTAAAIACGSSLPTSAACTSFKNAIAPIAAACNGGGGTIAGCDPVVDAFCDDGVDVFDDGIDGAASCADVGCTDFDPDDVTGDPVGCDLDCGAEDEPDLGEAEDALDSESDD